MAYDPEARASSNSALTIAIAVLVLGGAALAYFLMNRPTEVVTSPSSTTIINREVAPTTSAPTTVVVPAPRTETRTTIVAPAPRIESSRSTTSTTTSSGDTTAPSSDTTTESTSTESTTSSSP